MTRKTSPPPGTAYSNLEFHEETHEVGNLSCKIVRPLDSSKLLDLIPQEEFEKRDEIMPYWADLWPGALGLARYTSDLALKGLRVCDLGCGLGLNGITAALKGADVFFADYDPEALIAAKNNFFINGFSAFRGAAADWNRWPSIETFDLILGADIIYEERNHIPVIRLISSALKKGGKALLSDPFRPHYKKFRSAAVSSGFFVSEKSVNTEFLKKSFRVNILELTA
ncbi:MAG: class I SAM-dependent methyltransferase [Fibrobacterota bacterium]